MFCESISKGFCVTDTNNKVNARVVTIYKEHNSVKNVDGVTGMADNALYLY